MINGFVWVYFLPVITIAAIMAVMQAVIVMNATVV